MFYPLRQELKEIGTLVEGNQSVRNQMIVWITRQNLNSYRFFHLPPALTFTNLKLLRNATLKSLEEAWAISGFIL